ncbi:hypothetical protein ACWDG9_31370 [Streptomyces sp. NPDC001073]
MIINRCLAEAGPRFDDTTPTGWAVGRVMFDVDVLWVLATFVDDAWSVRQQPLACCAGWCLSQVGNRHGSLHRWCVMITR